MKKQFHELVSVTGRSSAKETSRSGTVIGPVGSQPKGGTDV